MGNWRGCGGGLMASRGRFLVRGSWIQFRNQSASILPPNIMHFSRDRATIGPRSGCDWATIAPRSWSWSFVDRRPLDWRRFHHVNSLIAARSRRDRGSIGLRSWSSSRKLLNRPMKIRSQSTRCSHRARSRPSDEDPPIKIAPRASP